MKDKNDTGFTCAIQVHASQGHVWKVLLSPEKWGEAFGEGTLVYVVWEEGASIIWKDAEGDVGASGRVEIIQPTCLLQLRYYDDVMPAVDASLGDYYEKFTIIRTSENFSRLEVEVGGVGEENAAFHRKLWMQAVEQIKKLAEDADFL